MWIFIAVTTVPQLWRNVHHYKQFCDFAHIINFKKFVYQDNSVIEECEIKKIRHVKCKKTKKIKVNIISGYVGYFSVRDFQLRENNPESVKTF